MGSGHILVYAFDVLYQIYLSQGYSEREIPDLILENNIYGLDIDERACQLAYFALMMKARSYNRRFFRREEGKAVPQPQVYSPQADAELLEYGSLYKVDVLDPMPEQAVGQIALEDMKYEDRLNDWNFRRLLNQKYDVVVTNPPYMGSSGMGAKLSEYVKKNYPDSKSDTSTAFMEKALYLCKHSGYMAMINIPVWMFLSSYEKLRYKLLKNSTVINMIHLGRGVFGADFGTTSFIINREHISSYIANYRRLFLKQGAVDGIEKKNNGFLTVLVHSILYKITFCESQVHL
jgi:type I restriction-modification system DNA methylase subunit